MTDLYDDLGVAPDADAAAIKRAYLKRARKTHPDAGGNGEDFNRLARAYEVLDDPEKRARYDQTGSAGPSLGEDISLVVKLFHEAVQKAMAGGSDPRQVRLMKIVQDALMLEAEQCRKAIDDLEKQAERADDIASRIEHDGENILRESMEGVATRFRSQARDASCRLEVFESAQEIAKGYTYRSDEPESATWPGMGSKIEAIMERFNKTHRRAKHE